MRDNVLHLFINQSPLEIQRLNIKTIDWKKVILSSYVGS